MKNKILIILLIIFLFILFAIPIPISIFGFFFSFIWVLGSLMEGLSFLETTTVLCGLIIIATYILTYIFALMKTCKETKLSIKTFLPIAHCLLFVLFLLCLKPINNHIYNTRPYFGFTKQDFAVVEELDTHGGFVGDGSHYLILDCSDNKQKALEIIKEWNKLPLPETLNITMFGGEKDGVAYGYELAEKAHMPKIKNGYYIFEDRHSESNDSKDDSGLLGRHSFNFSMAVYDCDTDNMYYFEFDT